MEAIKIGVYKWGRVLVSFSVIITVPMIFLVLAPQQFSSDILRLLLVVTILSFLAVHLFLFFKPQVLYGIPLIKTAAPSNSLVQKVVADNTVLNTDKNILNNKAASYYEFSNLETYKPVLDEYMQSTQAFLKQGYSIQDLSRETNIPLYHLSPLLNRIYKMRFTDYINGLRITFIEENFGEAEWENLTLEGIAKQAGFTSRTTFFNAIKKITGVTPSEFIAGLKGQEPEIDSPVKKET